MSLSKVVGQRIDWSSRHTYQQYFKNKVCLQILKHIQPPRCSTERQER